MRRDRKKNREKLTSNQKQILPFWKTGIRWNLSNSPRQKAIYHWTNSSKGYCIARRLLGFFIKTGNDKGNRWDNDTLKTAWRKRLDLSNIQAEDFWLDKIYIPIKNRRTIRSLNWRQAGIRSDNIDQPIEQPARYLADGTRWSRYDDGHIPTIHCVYKH